MIIRHKDLIFTKNNILSFRQRYSNTNNNGVDETKIENLFSKIFADHPITFQLTSSTSLIQPTKNLSQKEKVECILEEMLFHTPHGFISKSLEKFLNHFRHTDIPTAIIKTINDNTGLLKTEHGRRVLMMKWTLFTAALTIGMCAGVGVATAVYFQILRKEIPQLKEHLAAEIALSILATLGTGLIAGFLMWSIASPIANKLNCPKYQETIYQALQRQLMQEDPSPQAKREIQGLMSIIKKANFTKEEAFLVGGFLTFLLRSNQSYVTLYEEKRKSYATTITIEPSHETRTEPHETETSKLLLSRRDPCPPSSSSGITTITYGTTPTLQEEAPIILDLSNVADV